MYPMDFEEYCLANGVQPQTIDTLHGYFDERRSVPEASHEVMMRLWRSYIIVGGMPEVVQRYVETHDIAQAVGLQRDILALYRQDIAKYTQSKDSAKVRAIFETVR